jgi:hypothetical protein
MSLDGATRTKNSRRFCLSTPTQEQSQAKGLDNKHFPIRRTRSHLVTQLSAANGNK